MTPLLAEIMSHYLRRKSERNQALLDLIDPFKEDLHSFDLTHVAPLMFEGSEWGESPERDLVFAPAPRTWLEFSVHPTVAEVGLSSGVEKVAILLTEETEEYFEIVLSFVKGTDGRIRHRALPVLHKVGINDAWPNSSPTGVQLSWQWALYLINQPGMIGRSTHLAHKGKMRRLSNLGVGKFPLGAWTELKIGAPTKDAGGQNVEARLADRKPLHFVRSYIRPSTGVRVQAHWRGNAAYGIKRTRYKVER